MSSSVNVSLQPMPFGDAPSENLPRKIQSSGQYLQQGLTLLEALCSSSWSRSSNAAMSAFKKKDTCENKIDRRRHIFWLDRLSRYSLHKHDANSNSNKKLQSLPFPWYFQKITNDRFLTFFLLRSKRTTLWLSFKLIKLEVKMAANQVIFTTCSILNHFIVPIIFNWTKRLFLHLFFHFPHEAHQWKILPHLFD